MPVSSDRAVHNMSFDIPSGLTELLQEFTVSVLRSHPDDLYQFAADYFNDRRAGLTKNLVANGVSSSDDQAQRSVPVITTTLSHHESSDEELSGEYSLYSLENSKFDSLILIVFNINFLFLSDYVTNCSMDSLWYINLI